MNAPSENMQRLTAVAEDQRTAVARLEAELRSHSDLGEPSFTHVGVVWPPHLPAKHIACAYFTS